MKNYSLYDAATGIFTGQSLSLPPAMLQANLPPGLAAIEGLFNEHAQRVDLATGEVVAWQAPRPAGDEWREWNWDADAQRWRSMPTARAEQLERVQVLEAGQARALRALALNPGDAAARERLSSIEAAIVASGIRGPAPGSAS